MSHPCSLIQTDHSIFSYVVAVDLLRYSPVTVELERQYCIIGVKLGQTMGTHVHLAQLRNFTPSAAFDVSVDASILRDGVTMSSRKSKRVSPFPIEALQ